MWGKERVAYLMILDGEQDKALRVLLQERLVEFNRLDDLFVLLSLGRLQLGGLGVVGINLRLEGGEARIIEGLVLLVRRVEVELLDRRFHLEGLNCRCSLVEDITVSMHNARRTLCGMTARQRD